jgi:ADP-ribose pyrophosphatase YjhB (NUDIX family)
MMSFLAKLWRALHLPTNLQLRIMRFLNDEFLIGLTAIIFNDKNEILVVKHTYRHVEWGLPGGYLKAREHPTEGLERELKEETGFTVSIDEPLKVKTDRNTGRLDMCYIGTFIGGDFTPSVEVVGYGFFSFDTLPLILPDQLITIKDALLQRNSSFHPNLPTQMEKDSFMNKLKKLLS